MKQNLVECKNKINLKKRNKSIKINLEIRKSNFFYNNNFQLTFLVSQKTRFITNKKKMLNSF